MKENCDNCNHQRSKLEMVMPDCSATVDYCKIGLNPETCKPEKSKEDYWKRSIERKIEIFKKYEKKIKDTHGFDG